MGFCVRVGLFIARYLRFFMYCYMIRGSVKCARSQERVVLPHLDVGGEPQVTNDVDELCRRSDVVINDAQANDIEVL